MWLLVAGMLLQFWLGVEALGPILPSHWFELGLMGTGMLSYSSFSTLGEIWLPVSTQCDLRLGHVLMERAWREESTGDVRCQGGIFWSPKAPACLGRFLLGSSASPQG